MESLSKDDLAALEATPTYIPTVTEEVERAGPVPILLGGPWQWNGDDWEWWEDGAAEAHALYGAYQAEDGCVAYPLTDGSIEKTGRPHDIAKVVFRAPENWRPTPATIPKGCIIQTPEGVTRACETCSNYSAAGCHEGRGQECNPRHAPDGRLIVDHLLWCPR